MSDTWTLFRFRAINQFLWQELEFSELYFASPEQLNDPFDCRVNWKSAIRNALQQNICPQRREDLELILKEFTHKDPHLEAGICCFTVNLDNPLMWSHYANSHSGVCLYYEIPSDFFVDQFPTGNDPYFVGVSPVSYGDRNFTDWLVSGDLGDPVAGEAVESAVARIFSTKSSHWAHEMEARLVMSRPGPIQIDPRFLKQITFGFKATERDKNLVAKTALRNHENMEFYEAQESSKSEIGLEYIERWKAD